jgi:hypothetical protein
MMGTSYSRKIFGWIVLLFFILACASPLAAATPTAVVMPQAKMQETLDSAIVGTAAAAQTLTETLRPPTSTPTLTGTPSRTPTVTFTPTPTFIYSLFSATPAPAILAMSQTAQSDTTINLGDNFRLEPIPTEKWSDANQWRCFVRYSPHPKVRPSEKFYASWTVVNTGWRAWSSNTIDFVYKGGIRGGRLNIQDIPSTVSYGRTLNLGTKFTAPKSIGEYNSLYVLKVDASRKTELCLLRMVITVEK